ncbi:MAG: hypothetical protein IKY27_00315 [Bacteroidales bacterium]|nr:hypothetical protein [Bacteroidales bacterium]
MAKGKNNRLDFKSNAIKAAKDFGYGDDVVKKIRAAKTDGEIDRIMKAARKEKFG